MEENGIRKAVFDAIEASLEAQLRAVRRLKTGKETTSGRRPQKGMSQVNLAYDILKKARQPLHVTEIIRRIEMQYGKRIDRESLVSSLAKKIQREDRFIRKDRNVYGLLEWGK